VTRGSQREQKAVPLLQRPSRRGRTAHAIFRNFGSLRPVLANGGLGARNADMVLPDPVGPLITIIREPSCRLGESLWAALSFRTPVHLIPSSLEEANMEFWTTH
jgi:hypothetical protein